MEALEKAKRYAMNLCNGGEDIDEAKDIIEQTYDLSDTDSDCLSSFMDDLWP